MTKSDAYKILPPPMEWPGEMGEELTQEEVNGFNRCRRKCAEIIAEKCILLKEDKP